MKIKGIRNIKHFSKGKRGLIYTGLLKGKKVGIKIKNPKSEAVKRIKNEAKYLRILNKHKIGPKFVSFKNNKLVYEFVEGDFILDFIEKNDKEKVKNILIKTLNQMHKLDKLKIDKEEMHRPIKHIVIEKGKPVLLDFERAHETKKPKNVTQFCQFLISNNLNNILIKKGFKIKKGKIIKLAKKYKHEMNKKNFNGILKEIK